MSRVPTRLRGLLLASVIAVPVAFAACSPGTNSGATDDVFGATDDPSMLDVTPSPSDGLESDMIESESPS